MTERGDRREDVRPRVLRPDNTTPPTRTPWGGRAIARDIKRDLVRMTDDPVGESWEVSVEPSFPSRTADTGEFLADVIARDPAAWLGAGAARHGGQTPVLVKLLDTAANLSVQVHPETGDPALAEDESGKPEGWYVLAAAPGAVLYIGFRDGVEREDVAACLAAGGALDALMNAVPVAPGDAFVLAAGTPHAVGAGVTLVEPQLVYPGRRGVTYRFWDWNRRYDADGRLVEVPAGGRRITEPAGSLRPLHLARAMAVTRWDGPRGAEAVDACRQSPRVIAESSDDDAVTRARVISWRHFEVEAWRGTGALSLPAFGAMLAVVCVGGALDLATERGGVSVRSGESAVIPAAAGAVGVTARDAHAVVTWCP